MQKTPLLSVLITSYNREKFIGEAIESVLASTYPNFEVIVVDDGSTDNTIHIINRYADIDKRIRLFINEKNLGDYPNRNHAASLANGEFIMYVDSDDMILKDGFERCINAMQQFPDKAFGMFSFSGQSAVYYQDPSMVIAEHFFKKPSLMIGPGGTILRRSFFESIGRYPVKYGPANDLYFNLKAAARAGVVFLPFEFIFYRIHEGQEQNNMYSYLYNNYRYLRDALLELDLPLTLPQMQWIGNKNKRRFLLNLLQYLKKSKNISKTIQAKKLAGFSLADAWKGLFHASLKG